MSAALRLADHAPLDAAPFVKTAKQREACAVLNSVDHGMLYGGARSGKTTVAVRNILIRGLQRPSRHLIVRHAFNHVKQSIIHDTLPKVIKGFFPGLRKHPQFKLHKTDWYLTLPTINDSVDPYDTDPTEIWFGGTDSEERVEKILGNEYSTIYANECSQIAYEAITTLRTRLAENSGLSLKFYYDCNPPGKKHWSYQEFHEGLIPGTLDKTTLNTGFLLMNPKDNLDNLPAAFMDGLRALPKRQRDRYLEGLYLSEIEGALWDDFMISFAHSLEPGLREETVIAVDPAVTNNPDSDETGIVVASRDVYGQGVVEADLSGKFRTKVWAQRAVRAYHHYNANYIVAEVNQGGDLVYDAIKDVDKAVKIIKIHAKKGKFSRAEPVSGLYECEEGQVPKVCHPKHLPILESEMTEWVPFNTKRSPNRLDALVYALTHLLIKRPRERRVAVI